MNIIKPLFFVLAFASQCVVHAQQGHYRIVNQATNLAVTAPVHVSQTITQQVANPNNPYQRWVFVLRSDGTQLIVNPCTGYSLSAPDRRDNAIVLSGSGHPRSYDTWRVKTFSSSDTLYEELWIDSAVWPNKTLDVRHKHSNSAVLIDSAHRRASQRWYRIPLQ